MATKAYRAGMVWNGLMLAEVLSVAGKDRRGRFICTCKAEFEARISNVKAGATTSCGDRDVHPDPRWIEAPGYQSAHHRVRVSRGPAKDHVCIACGTTGRAVQWAYLDGDLDFLTETEGRPSDGLRYSTNPWNYVPLCAPCHHRTDKRHNARMNGSELVDFDRHTIGHLLSQAQRLAAGLPAVSPTDPTFTTDE